MSKKVEQKFSFSRKVAITSLSLLSGILFTTITYKPANSESSQDLINHGLSQSNAVNLIANTWHNLNTLYETDEACSLQITRLPDMGLRGLYCHIQPEIDYQKLQEISQVNIFVKGSHTPSELNLESQYTFGYYNPDFVKWLDETAVETITNKPALVTATQPIYNQQIKEQARIYYIVYKFLQHNPEQAQFEIDTYLKHLENRTLPELYLQEQFRELADTLESEGYNWYEANTASGFWLRRKIDGTDSQFFIALNKLLLTYDAEFIADNLY